MIRLTTMIISVSNVRDTHCPARRRIRRNDPIDQGQTMIIGLDVGGTHTDVVLVGENGLERRIKVPTDTSALFDAVFSGLEHITRDIDISQISHAVLSTTLTTNAIVQDKLPAVGIIVTCGPGIDPEYFRTCEHYYRVAGAMDHSGREIVKLDEKAVEDAAARMRDAGIEYVGVVGKFSIRNPAHEIRIREIISPMFQKVFLGHNVSGNFSFPRRITTAFLNASVYPLHKRFFEAVRQSLDKKGIQIPIYILKADGGTMDFETSIDFPGQSILSGPAASVMGSIGFATGDQETIVLDIGGTTTDMAVLINGVPVLAPYGIEIAEHKTLIRALHSYSVGLGGDSTVRVEHGHLFIGPDRTGPAMAYGGPEPTPTDALFVLGKAQNGDREKAEKGIEAIAQLLGISTAETARRIFDQTCREILDSARQMVSLINSRPVYTVREALHGHRIKPARLLVLGGPAPMFAENFTAVSDYQVSVVPHWDVANAVGTALSRTTCEVTLFADTYKLEASAPEEMFVQALKPGFTMADAKEMATELLEKKALREGASSGDLVTDVTEALEFNMVRDFRMIGKNIRIKVQVRPGLIGQYEKIIAQIKKQSRNGENPC
ncbi:N-methylhydantoinase A/oxoprolinase/acetone carboxylase beta subunit [Desulfosalsimonas propionicica]|uniref:N-methylhydantoinase A/oxoprolinase/acetone carboxylase beta subunit n=2 Tax=Desulfosalsimonas propionicica TaxID=332175 RepID=A0A7W0HJ91_9BACT|nr:N-methylhydantoinase A/oxoprolinase/acetone carboxylase beta subunit [Desulfosalsimonas propionicica]